MSLPLPPSVGASPRTDYLRRQLLELDLSKIRENSKYEGIIIKTTDVPDPARGISHPEWELMIPGRNQWATHVYMCQITFSRRHPYEPPSVSFPMNTHNLRVPKAPKVDGMGRLRIDILSLDNWSPVRSMPEVLDAILSIFDEDHTASDLHCSQGSPRDNQDMQYKDTNQKVSAYDDDVKSVLLTNPCHQTPDSALENLAFDILLSVCHYLTTNDISCLACANKRMLTVTYSNDLWASLYYTRCRVPATHLYASQTQSPLRVYAGDGVWKWDHAKDAYINSLEMLAYEGKQMTGVDDYLRNELRCLACIAHREELQQNHIIESDPTLNTLNRFAYGSAEGTLAMKMIKYRLRRSARIYRWFHGDIGLLQAAQISTSHISASTLFFLSTLDRQVVHDVLVPELQNLYAITLRETIKKNSDLNDELKHILKVSSTLNTLAKESSRAYSSTDNTKTSADHKCSHDPDSNAITGILKNGYPSLKGDSNRRIKDTSKRMDDSDAEEEGANFEKAVIDDKNSRRKVQFAGTLLEHQSGSASNTYGGDKLVIASSSESSSSSRSSASASPHPAHILSASNYDLSVLTSENFSDWERLLQCCLMSSNTHGRLQDMDHRNTLTLMPSYLHMDVGLEPLMETPPRFSIYDKVNYQSSSSKQNQYDQTSDEEKAWHSSKFDNLLLQSQYRYAPPKSMILEENTNHMSIPCYQRSHDQNTRIYTKTRTFTDDPCSFAVEYSSALDRAVYQILCSDAKMIRGAGYEDFDWIETSSKISVSDGLSSSSPRDIGKGGASNSRTMAMAAMEIASPANEDTPTVFTNAATSGAPPDQTQQVGVTPTTLETGIIAQLLVRCFDIAKNKFADAGLSMDAAVGANIVNLVTRAALPQEASDDEKVVIIEGNVQTMLDTVILRYNNEIAEVTAQANAGIQSTDEIIAEVLGDIFNHKRYNNGTNSNVEKDEGTSLGQLAVSTITATEPLNVDHIIQQRQYIRSERSEHLKRQAHNSDALSKIIEQHARHYSKNNNSTKEDTYANYGSGTSISDVYYGPDIYDLLELFHEAHVASSLTFNDPKGGQVFDVRDRHGAWLPAIVQDQRYYHRNPFVQPNDSENDGMGSKYTDHYLKKDLIREKAILLFLKKRYLEEQMRLIQETVKQQNHADMTLTGSSEGAGGTHEDAAMAIDSNMHHNPSALSPTITSDRHHHLESIHDEKDAASDKRPRRRKKSKSKDKEEEEGDPTHGAIPDKSNIKEYEGASVRLEKEGSMELESPPGLSLFNPRNMVRGMQYGLASKEGEDMGKDAKDDTRDGHDTRDKCTKGSKDDWKDGKGSKDDWKDGKGSKGDDNDDDNDDADLDNQDLQAAIFSSLSTKASTPPPLTSPLLESIQASIQKQMTVVKQVLQTLQEYGSGSGSGSELESLEAFYALSQGTVDEEAFDMMMTDEAFVDMQVVDGTAHESTTEGTSTTTPPTEFDLETKEEASFTAMCDLMMEEEQGGPGDIPAPPGVVPLRDKSRKRAFHNSMLGNPADGRIYEHGASTGGDDSRKYHTDRMSLQEDHMNRPGIDPELLLWNELNQLESNAFIPSGRRARSNDLRMSRRMENAVAYHRSRAVSGPGTSVGTSSSDDLNKNKRSKHGPDTPDDGVNPEASIDAKDTKESPGDMAASHTGSSTGTGSALSVSNELFIRARRERMERRIFGFHAGLPSHPRLRFIRHLATEQRMSMHMRNLNSTHSDQSAQGSQPPVASGHTVSTSNQESSGTGNDTNTTSLHPSQPVSRSTTNTSIPSTSKARGESEPGREKPRQRNRIDNEYYIHFDAGFPRRDHVHRHMHRSSRERLMEQPVANLGQQLRKIHEFVADNDAFNRHLLGGVLYEQRRVTRDPYDENVYDHRHNDQEAFPLDRHAVVINQSDATLLNRLEQFRVLLHERGMFRDDPEEANRLLTAMYMFYYGINTNDHCADLASLSDILSDINSRQNDMHGGNIHHHQNQHSAHMNGSNTASNDTRENAMTTSDGRVAHQHHLMDMFAAYSDALEAHGYTLASISENDIQQIKEIIVHEKLKAISKKDKEEAAKMASVNRKALPSGPKYFATGMAQAMGGAALLAAMATHEATDSANNDSANNDGNGPGSDNADASEQGGQDSIPQGFNINTRETQLRELGESPTKLLEQTNNLFEIRPSGMYNYDYFNFNRYSNIRHRIRVRYANFETEHNEELFNLSNRVAPFRSNTERVSTLVRDNVDKLANVSQMMKNPSYMQLRVRCLWLAHRPGAGLLRVHVPDSITVKEILREYSRTMNLNPYQLTCVHIDMSAATNFALFRRRQPSKASELIANMKKSKLLSLQDTPGVTMLDESQSLAQCGVVDGQIIDVLYNCRKGETLDKRSSRF